MPSPAAVPSVADMENQQLSEALAKLTAADLGVDQAGRVVILNREVSKLVNELADPEIVDTLAGTNPGCTNNAPHCGAIAEQ